jgi:hypothetical protein
MGNLEDRPMSELTTEDTENTEHISLTPLGLLANCLEKSDAQAVAMRIELYMRRHGVGMAIDNNKLSFVTLVEAGK